MRKYLLSCAVLALASLLLAACGDKGGGGGLGGGGGGGAVGTWTLDVSATEKAMYEGLKAKGPEGEAMKPLLDMVIGAMKSGAATVTFEVKPDNTWRGEFHMEMMGEKQSDTSTGTWRSEGSGFAFKKTSGGEGTDPDEKEMKGYIRDGKLHVEKEPGETMVLKRK